MTLYFVQATDCNGESLDLHLRLDDEGDYDRDSVLKVWRDFYNGGDEGEDRTLKENDFPTRVFALDDLKEGALAWHEIDGAFCVDDFENNSG